MRLEVAVLRRQWVQTVIGQHDRLRVPKLHEDTGPKHVVRLHAVELACGDRLTRCRRSAGEQGHVRALTLLGDRVARLQAVAATAQIRGELRGEFVARRQEDLRAETLEQRAPGLIAWQSRDRKSGVEG